ncbi:hypothetical protein [Mongoliitalea lutea]|uniref:Uncharacterized protein n=1 Tax=Mongoliitalea lutea TaxID=849756 RepID=A0A8J3CVI4_9BACT|nr:hypothetical protein [Mongoliitalea lutea]GHB27314.1 hypothetical protein GCM10008106_05060 [Mongoliitalea lutea]
MDAMKKCIILIVLMIGFSPVVFGNDIEVIYKENPTQDVKEYTLVELVGNNNIDRYETLLGSFEKRIKSFAKEKGAKNVELIILEKVQCKISNEATIGNSASIKLMYRLD